MAHRTLYFSVYLVCLLSSVGCGNIQSVNDDPINTNIASQSANINGAANSNLDVVENFKIRFGTCLQGSSLYSDMAKYAPMTYRQLLAWFGTRNKDGVGSPLHNRFKYEIKNKIDRAASVPGKKNVLYVKLGNLNFNNPGYGYEIFWDYAGAFVVSYFPKSTDSRIFSINVLRYPCSI